jgi:hypothetical protein
MKRCVIMLIAVCVLGTAAAGVALLVGCQSHSTSEDSMPSQVIPEDFMYAGNRYIYTDVKVASQDIDASTPSSVMYIGSTSYQIGEYDVYLIQGLDENEAIALKIGRGGGYTYYRYERVYGQEEPADFVYEGRDYKEAGEIIDIESVGSAAGTPEAVSYLSSVIYQGTTYDVYSIQGVDKDQAIALRIAKAGTKVGFYYYYFKYERR